MSLDASDSDPTTFWSYVVAALLYGGSVGGISLGLTASLVLVLLGSALCFTIAGRVAAARQRDLLAASVSLLFALLAADTAFTVWVNVQRSGQASAEQREYDRLGDPQIWHGEFFPRSYYPSDQNFMLFKPNVRVEAVTYGEFYEPRQFNAASQSRVDEALVNGVTVPNDVRVQVDVDPVSFL